MSALTITDLKKTYANGVQALKGISFTVKEGDFFALLGPNGAGKSTTIGIVTSLVRKSEGRIQVFGYDLEQDGFQAKRLIGLVPQEFNFSIFETVEGILLNQAGYYGVPRSLAKVQTEKYLRKLGLWEKRKEVAGSLSGGMKRRLMIARGIVHDPKLLILDEPTAGVDIEIRRSTWDFLREINRQGTTVILTTHYLEEAERLCQRVAIINRGKIIKDTSVKALIQELNRETFVFDLGTSLEQAPDLEDYPCRLTDEQTLEVEVLKEQDLNALFAVLSTRNIPILSMRNKSNRLEELFVNLTTPGETE